MGSKEAIDVPNLDVCSDSELTAFLDACESTTGIVPRRVAVRMFPSKPLGMMRVATSLRNYALNRQIASWCRLRGDIQAALSYERICDKIYARLPGWARW